MRAEFAGSLARFQDAFVRALFHEPSANDTVAARLAAQPAFAVYRNTVVKGCIDALQANFPAVARLVGEEWFRAAAGVYVALQHPREPSLLRYGASFPVFLAAFPPARELPYLADVARLDRLWTDVHAAADGSVLEPAAITALGPPALASAVLHPHPAARWSWFAEAPIYTIWRRNREQDPDESEIDWQGEGALLTRPAGAVRWTALDAPGCRFLDACAQGLPVSRALEGALAADADADLVRLMATLLEAGALGRLTSSPDNPA